MDIVLRPAMRGLDRIKMVLSRKKPTVPHAPYTRDMRHIMAPDFLAEPELFYFRPQPTSQVEVASERVIDGRR